MCVCWLLLLLHQLYPLSRLILMFPSISYWCNKHQNAYFFYKKRECIARMTSYLKVMSIFTSIVFLFEEKSSHRPLFWFIFWVLLSTLQICLGRNSLLHFQQPKFHSYPLRYTSLGCIHQWSFSVDHQRPFSLSSVIYRLTQLHEIWFVAWILQPKAAEQSAAEVSLQELAKIQWPKPMCFTTCISFFVCYDYDC